jgi:hypothetical protein
MVQPKTKKRMIELLNDKWVKTHLIQWKNSIRRIYREYP